MGHATPVKVATPGRRASRLPVRSLRSAPVAVRIAILMVVIAMMPFEARVAAQGKPGVDVRGTWDWITDSVQQGKTYYYPSRLSLVLETQDVETGKVSGTVTGSSSCGEPPWSKRSTPPRSAVAPCKGRFLPARGVVERDTIEITMGIFVATAKLVVRDGKLTASGEWHHTGKDFTSTIRGTLVEPLVVTGDRSSATFVICNRDLLAQDEPALLTCTASVADASGRTPALRPTGSVAWTTDAGQVAPRSCLLSGSVGSVGSVASCTVQVTARTTDIPMGTAPPVTAAYPGSDEFAPSSGSPRLYGAARGFTASDLYGPGCNPAAIPTTSVGCGDPVDPATGSLSLETADLAMVRPGLALAVVRSYDSAAAAAGVSGRFGHGWSDDHAARVEEGPGRKVTVHLGTGATVPFTVRGNRITSPDWVTATLRRGPRKGWTLTFADQGRLVFDRKGRLVTIDDRRREPVTLAYGEAGALIAATDAAGQALTYASDAEGQFTSVSDPTGRTVGYEYDDAGDLIAVTDVAGDVTRYTYDEDHRLTSITDATGATATTSYDARGRVREQVDPLGNTLSFEYLGAFPELMTIATDGAGVRHAFMYGRGVLVRETRALGTDVEATTHHLHDERLAEVAVIDPAGALWRTTRDDAGRVLASTDPLDRITAFSYDEDGDVVSVTTPMGLVTRIGYDERKLPRSMTVAAGTESEATLSVARDDPDHPSWVTGVTDLAGGTTTIGHDELGRIAGFTDALGAAWAATRDDHGWVMTVTDPLGTTASVVRDARGMVTSSTDPLGASSSLELDSVGRAVSVTDALGNTTTLTRDAAGRPLSLGLADGTSARAARDPRGSLLTQTNALGATSIIELDALGRRTAWADPIGNTWRWAYDAVGNRVATTDPLGQITRYTWDAASQLVGVDYPDGTPDVNFEYDLDGRRVSMTDSTGRTTYGWDALGRLVEVVDGSGARVTTTWDAGGRLRPVDLPRRARGRPRLRCRRSSGGAEG